MSAIISHHSLLQSVVLVEGSTGRWMEGSRGYTGWRRVVVAEVDMVGGVGVVFDGREGSCERPMPTP